METIKVDVRLWNSLRFLIDGLAIMGTLRQSYPDLNETAILLSRAIEHMEAVGTTAYDA